MANCKKMHVGTGLSPKRQRNQRNGVRGGGSDMDRSHFGSRIVPSSTILNFIEAVTGLGFIMDCVVSPLAPERKHISFCKNKYKHHPTLSSSTGNKSSKCLRDCQTFRSVLSSQQTNKPTPPSCDSSLYIYIYICALNNNHGPVSQGHPKRSSIAQLPMPT